jgi:hypothetical protein
MISSSNFQLFAGFRPTYGMQPYVLAWMFITMFVSNIFQAWSFNWDSVVFLMLLWCGCLCVAHSATFVDDCQLATNVTEFFGAVLYLFFWCCLITYLFCFMLLSLQLVSAATALQTLFYHGKKCSSQWWLDVWSFSFLPTWKHLLVLGSWKSNWYLKK